MGGRLQSGIGWLAFIVIARLVGGITVSGFASLMAGITLFGGLQLLILGIFGEYLWRALEEVRGRPRFLIEESTPRRGGGSA